MKKNILICHVHMQTGGIETSLVNLLNSLDKNKYDIDLVLFYPTGPLLDLIPDWINIIPIWKTKGKSHKFLKKIILSRNIICRVIKNIICNTFTAKLFVPNKKYDFALAYSGYSNFIDTVAGMSNASKKFIWVHADFLTQYNIDASFKKKFKSIYKKYKYFDKIVVVSNSAANNLKDLCPELSNKITYQWNINKERKLETTTGENIVFDNNYYNIVAIARLAKYKGIERLVLTAALLKEANIKFKVYVLGDGPNRQNIETMITNLGLEDTFILLGNINNVFPILKQADLYVSPSDSEGFSSVTLESLICNVPVVATPTSSSKDIYEFIAPNGSMLLTETFTEKALFNTILKAKESLNKDFSFDIDELNKKILEEFEKKLNE